MTPLGGATQGLHLAFRRDGDRALPRSLRRDMVALPLSLRRDMVALPLSLRRDTVALPLSLRLDMVARRT